MALGQISQPGAVMTINLNIPNLSELKPRITVFGVGGAGGNAVNNMIESRLEGVEFVVANTDAQALLQNAATRRVQMGTALTQGLGAGSQPQIGAAAAEEALPEIMDYLAGAHMCFITAGMGWWYWYRCCSCHRACRKRAGHPDCWRGDQAFPF